MRKILSSVLFSEEQKQRIQREAGFLVETFQENDLNSYPQETDEEIEILFCYAPFDALNMEYFPNLQVIQLTSMGYDHVPDEYFRRGWTICNAHGMHKVSVAEWNAMSVLLLSRSYRIYMNRQDNKVWKRTGQAQDLSIRVVGIAGTGSIAKETARRLRPFFRRVIGYNTSGSSHEEFDEVYSASADAEFLAQCDYLILALPATDKTVHWLNEKRIALLKDGVHLINSSRGTIVDEEAVIRALQSGKIAGAALDVFEEEPLSANSPLWTMEQVYITPHVFYLSDSIRERMFELLMDNAKRHKNQEELKYRIL